MNKNSLLRLLLVISIGVLFAFILQTSTPVDAYRKILEDYQNKACEDKIVYVVATPTMTASPSATIIPSITKRVTPTVTPIR